MKILIINKLLKENKKKHLIHCFPIYEKLNKNNYCVASVVPCEKQAVHIRLM